MNPNHMKQKLFQFDLVGIVSPIIAEMAGISLAMAWTTLYHDAQKKKLKKVKKSGINSL